MRGPIAEVLFSFSHRVLYVSIVSPRPSFSRAFSFQLGCVHGWTPVRCDFFLPPFWGALPDIFIFEGYSASPPPQEIFYQLKKRKHFAVYKTRLERVTGREAIESRCTEESRMFRYIFRQIFKEKCNEVQVAFFFLFSFFFFFLHFLFSLLFNI